MSEILRPIKSESKGHALRMPEPPETALGKRSQDLAYGLRTTAFLLALFFLGLAFYSAPGWAEPQITEVVLFAAEPTELRGFSDISNRGALYFSGGPANNREPWSSTGKPSGTKMLKEVNGSTTIGSNPKEFVRSGRLSGGLVFFTADDGSGKGRQIFANRISEGTVERYDQFVTGTQGSNPQYLKMIPVEDWNYTSLDGEALFFSIDTTDKGTELAYLDRQFQETTVRFHLLDINPVAGAGSSPLNLTYGFHKQDGGGSYLPRFAESLLFSADDGTNGREYWRWDWHYGDLTTKNLRSGSAGSAPAHFTRFGNRTLFTADDGSHGRELWMDNSEGTIAMVKDINPGSSGSTPMHLNGSFFSAVTDAAGRELWKTDGTAAGTVMIKDINPGSGSSGIDNLSSFFIGSNAFFSATNGAAGYELWKSDGTAAGTVMVKDILPGAGSSNPRDLVEYGNKCYFTADDGAHGRELWVTDGTAAGTRLLFDLVKGPNDQNPRQLTLVKDRVFFTMGTSLYVFDPLATPPPQPVSNVAADASNTDWDSLRATWTPSPSEVDGYKFYCQPDNGSVPSVHLGTAPYENAVVNGLIPNTKYAFTVTAYTDEGGESLLPDPFYVTHWTLALPPTPSVNIEANAQKGVWVKKNPITFQNPQGFGTGNKVSYYQYAWDQSTSHTFLDSDALWTTGSLVRTIQASGIYYLHLRSRNFSGYGTYPWLSYGPFMVDLEAPTAPGTPQGTIPQLPNVRFDWAEAGDTGGSDVASYDCQIGTTPGGSNVFSGNVGSTLTKTVTGVSGSTYYARVRAVDRAGNAGPWSANSAGVAYTNQVGSLKVSFSPPVVALSGGWRRMGMATWLPSGAIETSVPVGLQTVEFRDVNNYMEPARKSVTINAGTQTVTSGSYTMAGTIQVTISPSEAVADGAQWRFYQLPEYPSGWKESGAKVEVRASAVPYTVQFKTLPAWGTPKSKGVSVSGPGSAATISGADATYTKDKGAIQVTILPSAAVAAGAQWRRTGTTTWRNSGTSETGVYVGNYTIEFKGVTNWTKPPNRAVTVLTNQTAMVPTADSTYVQNLGSLLVNIAPEDAVDKGAKWRRVGTASWRSTGIAETNIPIGNYEVEFAEAAPWIKPAKKNAVITGGSTATLDVTYDRNTDAREGQWSLYR